MIRSMVVNRAVRVDVLGVTGVFILRRRLRGGRLAGAQAQGGPGEQEKCGGCFPELHGSCSFDRMSWRWAYSRRL